MTGGLVDLRDWRLYREVERLHAAGPRVITELLLELAARTFSRTELDSIVARYDAAFGEREARQ